MPRSSAFVLTLVLTAVATAAAARQTSTQSAPPAPSPDGQTFGSRATAVVIDVVVRDDDGRPVTGLGRDDFVLLEDGVRQRIGDLVEVSGTASAGSAAGLSTATDAPGAGSDPPTPEPLSEAPRFLAIVLDRVSNEGRALAYKGALAALETLQEGDFVGVFLADQTLVTVQTYTNDRRRIEEAIRRVASAATSRLDRPPIAEDLGNRDERGNVQPGDAHPDVPVVAGAESAGRPVDGRTIVAREIQAVLAATANSIETLQRAQAGYATTNALSAVVSGLGVLPGRKSVVFFAEGLSIPGAVLPHFRSVVAAANRANVSVYTIDAAGLRVHSTDAVTGRAVRAMGAAGLSVNAAGDPGGTLRMLEGNEDFLRRDPRTSLRLLAEGTGGFLVENTNDLADAFRRAEADRRFYYLLTYAPSNAALDGTWRTVSVSVPGHKVRVRARSGYLATPDTATLPALTWEAAPLAALKRTPAPTDLPLRAAALVFPDGGEARVAILAAASGAALRVDRTGASYRAEVTIMARILDAGGTVVRQASQPYVLSGPADSLAGGRLSDLLFYRQPTLPPGAYTLEVAVHDALAGADGVARTRFEVPTLSPEGPDVSSLVLIARAEKAEGSAELSTNPLFVDGMLIYPNLGEPRLASPDLMLTFYLSLRRVRGTAPTVAMELLRGETRVAKGPLALPEPDAEGTIHYLGLLPIGGVAREPGDYTLRLTVPTSGAPAVRAVSFRVVR